MCLEYNGDLCPLVHFQCIEVTKCKVMTFDRESSSIYRYWAQQPNLFFDKMDVKTFDQSLIT